MLWCAVSLGGCATTQPHDGNAHTDQIDPYEDINRKSYTFTDTIDRKIVAPVADAYSENVPERLQRIIGNFYDNLAYPNVILNSFLQGKVRQGFQDTLRFTVNSTIGLAGLFDMATPMGLVQHDEDFGQTLGVWGVDAKTYYFIPLLGPSSNRDVPDIPLSVVTNGLFYAGIYMISAPVTVPLTILGAVDKRARLSGPMRLRDDAAVEPYLFVRDAYLQQRKHLIYDGNPPPEAYEDPDMYDASPDEGTH
ncbi:VacJ family lipoprotein [Nitrosovibrio sp. Nv17]|uniref:MlaA family lipoprotein n=1 Tax=Nitrosovibrio sp. Nv17 TaxID=1855339 RepID=UPI000930CA63|nr:VacJ family lipoprotein [Nitrosovibrio sp. Nv17]